MHPWQEKDSMWKLGITWYPNVSQTFDLDIMDICLSSLVFFPRCPWLEDIGMLDVSTSMLGNQASNFLSTNEIPQRLGNQHPNIVPYQAGGLVNLQSVPMMISWYFSIFHLSVHDIKATFVSFCFQIEIKIKNDSIHLLHTQPELTSNCCHERWCLPQMATSSWPWPTILPSSASSL